MSARRRLPIKAERSENDDQPSHSLSANAGSVTIVKSDSGLSSAGSSVVATPMSQSNSVLSAISEASNCEGAKNICSNEDRVHCSSSQSKSIPNSNGSGGSSTNDNKNASPRSSKYTTSNSSSSSNGTLSRSNSSNIIRSTLVSIMWSVKNALNLGSSNSSRLAKDESRRLTQSGKFKRSLKDFLSTFIRL